MSNFPNGVETQADAIRFLGAIDGRNSLELGAWDIGDFSSVSHSDPVIETCRCRVRGELIDLLASRDEHVRKEIAPLCLN